MRIFEYIVRNRYKSVREFCRESGLHQSSVYAYMEGRRFPSLPVFMLFAEMFNITAEDLWDNWFKEFNIDDKK